VGRIYNRSRIIIINNREERQKMNEYIVWVGGNIVYEDNNKIEAKFIADKYINWGYDDVIIETNNN